MVGRSTTSAAFSTANSKEKTFDGLEDKVFEAEVKMTLTAGCSGFDWADPYPLDGEGVCRAVA
jgi:hypothetical protein